MDTNRIIKIEELEVGEEILVPANGGFRYYKILHAPRINPKTKLFAVVRCSTRIEVEHLTRYWGGHSHNYEKEKYSCTSEDHNCKKSVNFRWKTMWLIKRGEDT